VQIRKHKDYRVNELAEFIEHLQDVKYHIKPFEMSEAIVIFMDDLRGKDYAKKIQEYAKEEKGFKK
jgi:hypothetical protein